jgi:hypothetical protein
MKALLATCAICVGIAASAHGDMYPPPFATHAISPDGSKVVRVTLGKWKNYGKRDPKDKVTVYSYNAKTDSYASTAKFDFGELYPSEWLFVSDSGRYLIAINIGHWLGEDALGIRVYSGDGRLLKKWKLSDFLSEKEIEACTTTGSTTQWFEDGELTKETFTFCGPAGTIKSWGSSSTVIGGKQEYVPYSFKIDLRKLELKKL